MIIRVAKELRKLWDSLNKASQWAIEQIAGSAIVEAISRGYQATVDYLSSLSSSVVNAIGKILGL